MLLIWHCTQIKILSSVTIILTSVLLVGNGEMSLWYTNIVQIPSLVPSGVKQTATQGWRFYHWINRLSSQAQREDFQNCGKAGIWGGMIFSSPSNWLLLNSKPSVLPFWISSPRSWWTILEIRKDARHWINWCMHAWLGHRVEQCPGVDRNWLWGGPWSFCD